ncbi:hypothetical protein GDO86_018581 [Hymenochirus boettgeri]|uniref:Uncharacterized protein n=1 Tax=Hymenochirus boettgeri TaxID=247094 RepID=A0A8T2IEG8_9PIPI|nr:hypothetical protein GDO86_018581 [Hymenochirus boettgeri]
MVDDIHELIKTSGEVNAQDPHGASLDVDPPVEPPKPPNIETEEDQVNKSPKPSQGSPSLSQRNGSLVSSSKHTFSKRLDRSVSYQLATQGELCPDLSHERSHHTLAELKRQRAAAKLQRHAPLPPPVSDPEPQDSSEPVYYTAASGDPPLLKLVAPAEETPPADKRPCCLVM